MKFATKLNGRGYVVDRPTRFDAITAFLKRARKHGFRGTPVVEDAAKIDPALLETFEVLS